LVQVVVIQPYVAAYRKPFYDELSARLRAMGDQLTVLHAQPRHAQAQRGDAVVGPWSETVTERRLGLGRATLRIKNVWPAIRNGDIVVSELASTCYESLLLAARGDPRLVVWGHGRSYVSGRIALDDWLELWLARRARMVLTYTDGGAQHLEARGIPRSKLVVVRNSTDTSALRKMRLALTPPDVRLFALRHELGSGPRALFVGGLDAAKQIPFLLAAADEAAKRDPSFHLIIAGRGEQENLVREAAANAAHVRWLPHASTDDLAHLSWLCQAIWMPGRIGLIAVDALALDLPIMTTTLSRDAPEAEYLVEGRSLFTLPHSPHEYAKAALRLADAPRSQNNDDNDIPSIAEMVDRFLSILT
jgi:glycosyltransferase involved in cell wall biosynthesis